VLHESVNTVERMAISHMVIVMELTNLDQIWTRHTAKSSISTEQYEDVVQLVLMRLEER